MATYGPDDVKIEFDNTGGSLVDMSAHITTFNGIKREALTVEATTFSLSAEAHAAVGVTRVNDVPLRGFYDDTATTGPDVIFNALGATRTLKITWGSTKTTSVETIIVGYDRIAQVGKLTEYEVTLRPTGAVTET